MMPDSHPSNSPTILVVGAVYETGNMGVDALLSGTITSILRAAPGAQIKILDYGHQPKSYTVPTPDGPRTIPLVNLRFSYRLQLSNNGFRIWALCLLLRLAPSAALRRFLEAKHPCLRVVSEADLFVSLAGGDSFSDIYGMRRLLYVALPQLIAIASKTPLVLLPQTLGPFKGRMAKAIGSFIMKRAQRVYSRDQESLTHARELLGARDQNLAFSRDMAFALEPVRPESGIPQWLENKTGPLVGLNVSGLLQMGGYSKDNMFGLSLDYPKLIESIILHFTTEEKVDLVLVTHVTGMPGGTESDATACQAIYDALSDRCEGRLHLADPAYNHREIKYLIGKCDFFLGARMHACIAALSQSVPAVGMAYSRKFKGVFESLEVAELVVDLRAESNESAMASIKALFGQRSRLAQTLSRSAGVAQHDAFGLFRSILSPSSGRMDPSAAAAEARPQQAEVR